MLLSLLINMHRNTLSLIIKVYRRCRIGSPMQALFSLGTIHRKPLETMHRERIIPYRQMAMPAPMPASLSKVFLNTSRFNTSVKQASGTWGPWLKKWQKQNNLSDTKWRSVFALKNNWIFIHG